jgi:uncharacterized protein
MTRDPGEGVGADGYLVTGAARTKVPPVYEPVLADCVAMLAGAFGPRLDGLYLYGSVATGQARPPSSDVDLLALWTSTVDTALVAAVTAALSTRSTDRGTGAALLARHHPEWTDVADRAVEWAAGRGTADGAGDLFALGDWLVGHP